jgi:hypothetical protein
MARDLENEADAIERESKPIALHDGSEPQPALMVCADDEPPSREVA